MNAPPRLFDRALRRHRLERQARRPRGVDFLSARAAEDLTERLLSINRRFALAVDLTGGRSGFAAAASAGGACGQIDRLIDGIVLDEEQLPFCEAGVDLIVSVLSLHWVNDLVGALIQIRRALAPDGLFLGSLLGGATLTELRQCVLAAELEMRGGAGPRVSPFIDPRSAADLMQRAGFAMPVVDVDTLIVRYDNAFALLADLREMAETSALVDRPAAPLTRSIIARVGALYAERFGGPDGRIQATFEIINLTGWAPHPGQPRPLRPESAKASLADVLRRS